MENKFVDEFLGHYGTEQAPDSDYLQHWKYVKREKVNGKWKYWYELPNGKVIGNKPTPTTIKENVIKEDVIKEQKIVEKKIPEKKIPEKKISAKEFVEKTVDKTIDSALAKVNNAPEKLNKVVDKAKEVGKKIYDDPDNIYNITSGSYKEKIEKVKQTDEWKKIVASNDPEYVKTKSDGSKQYLIDEYLVKKKHPVIDIVSDIAADREITVNEITKESTVAGLKENAFAAITTGIMVAGVASKLLTEKFKLKQGSYDDEINAVLDTINAGSSYVEKNVGKVDPVKVEDAKKVIDSIGDSDVTKVTKSINEGNVVEAARVIVESETVKSKVGSNEYYKLLETSLAGMSEEEIALVNLLVREMMNAKHDGMSDEDILQHYGVKGQKWGIRRYQNADGTLTSEGRKRAKQEYKTDNKAAYELGKAATIYGRAMARSTKRTIRYNNRLDKRLEKDQGVESRRTKFWKKRWLASAASTMQLSALYGRTKELAEKHCQSLIDKYGEEAVSSIKYKDIKMPKGRPAISSVNVMNERTNNLSDYARNGAMTVGSVAFSAMLGAPVALLFRPTSAAEKGYRVENEVYGSTYNALNKKK